MTTQDLFSLREPQIILLDYQCTLCSNGDCRKQWFANPDNRYRSFAEWIVQEQMRTWMIPLFIGKKVIMITARKKKWQDVTLQRIKKVTGWLPDEWYFNPDDSTPSDHKQRVIINEVFPKYGAPDNMPYLALESNANTRRMYVANNVSAIRIDLPITSLPRV